mmetsp:Transcript_3145/g.4437  ORF Transcript_3145/g.4437 Transcript_3145/m.4437 type:complete len:239 (-) Transcript_3145:141-857(-)
MVRHDYMGCLESVDVSSCSHTVDTHIAAMARNYSWSDIYTRPVWVLSMDRVRSGLGQWADRGEAWLACQRSSFCFTANELSQVDLQHRTSSAMVSKGGNSSSSGGKVVFVEQEQGAFKHMIASSRFLLIIHGGGLDPSPKCWETIALGTIPILVSGPLSDSYSLLPVAFVDSAADFLANPANQSMRLLEQWLRELGPYYVPHSELRNQTLRRLQMAFWWHRIEDKLSDWERNRTAIPS